MQTEAIINPSVWWAVFFVIVVFFVGYSIALIYHWTKFAMNKHTTSTAMVIYFFVAALILFLMLSATLALTT